MLKYQMDVGKTFTVVVHRTVHITFIVYSKSMVKGGSGQSAFALHKGSYGEHKMKSAFLGWKWVRAVELYNSGIEILNFTYPA